MIISFFIVKLGIEYAQKTKQNLVMLQLDYAKAFDTVADFTQQTLAKLGFGSKISNCIHLLGSHASSRILVNGRLSQPVYFSRSVRQGCSLSPLFFVVDSHPMFTFLDNQCRLGNLKGLQLAR